MLLTYLENGTEFTLDFGYGDSSFFNSLVSAMDELTQLILKEGVEIFRKFKVRLEELAQDADGIGWGYGDYVSDSVGGLEEEFEEDPDALGETRG